jgi:hypothetical protein
MLVNWEERPSCPEDLPINRVIALKGTMWDTFDRDGAGKRQLVGTGSS